MSPEERAGNVLADIEDVARVHHPFGESRASALGYVVEAIRAAEDEALERAALAADETGTQTAPGCSCEPCEMLRRAGHRIRFLKSGSVKGDRDGR